MSDLLSFLKTKQPYKQIIKTQLSERVYGIIGGSKMKTLLTRWIVVFLAFGLIAAACGNDDDSDTAQGSDAAQEEPAAQGSDAAPEEPAAQGSDADPEEEVTITIESWRSDDAAIWDDQIIPAFEAQFPNINVEFTPTVPTEYNAALDTRLAGGTAGDLITCRPFDAFLALY